MIGADLKPAAYGAAPLHWLRCAECQRETLVVDHDGRCELCVLMEVMEPVIAAINAGMEKTNNKARIK